MHRQPRHLPAAAALASLLLLAFGCSAPSQGLQWGPVAYPPEPEEPRYYYERTLIGTADAQSTSDEDTLRKILTGVSGKSNIPFAKPFDIAVHQGRVFISDTIANIVFALDIPGQKSFQVGNKGDEGDLGNPLGISVDGEGKLYVVDSRALRIAVYDRDGNYLTAFGGKETLDRPSGIVVNRDGSRAYVIDVGGVRSEKHHIQVFDPRNGALLHTIGSRGKGDGELNLPRDVALAPDGTLWVTDGGNFRVEGFTAEGEFLRTWGRPGLQFGDFSRPKGIATDREGNVLAVDAGFGNFQIFDPEGQLLLFIGRRSEQNGPGVFMLPAGIDVDEDGRIYVVDQFFRKVDIFRPASLPPEAGFLAGHPVEATP